MESRTIYNKLIVLLYIIVTLYLNETSITPWNVLFVLVYLCLNLAFYIVNHSYAKLLLSGLTCLIIAISAYYIHPFLALLLPINLYELILFYSKRPLIIVVAMLLPIIAIPQHILAIYGFIAVICFFVETLGRIHSLKAKTYISQADQMRHDIERLTKRLNENNEYIRQSEYTFKLEERNRLSQEIHDKIGHSMTGALIQMEAARRLIDTNPNKASELMQNAIQISKDGIDQIRYVLKNMKPPAEQLGVHRMKLFMEQFSAEHAIKTSFLSQGNVDAITPLQWKIIQENVKEALTNMLRYSGASEVSVDIRVLNTFVRAEVLDNGKGANKIVKGLGIQGMEERAASVNGTIIVDGSRGFSVTTLLPYCK